MAKSSKQEVLPSMLHAGDSIEMSWSFQAKIDGDEAWISYKVFAKVQDDESSISTHHRALSHLQAGIKDSTREAVKTARELGN